MTSLAMTSCQTSDVIYNGFVADDETLALAPVGSSKEQVLLSLGTPSATATFDNEVLYYVSQKRTRPVAFMKPKLVEQTVLAYYIGNDGNVERIGHYTLQDGKVFDMISRTTPTAGKDMTFLQQILSGGPSNASIANALSGGT
ncbi:outer membrane protein assembly factor BamE [Rhizobium sp. L1K21]|nr:outer membrane protein assembly factor BamE [Rhizobium sp. L1K21]MCO6185830.1 outer membrane protein assembly factor BamE [Rhizobium sp. L1K21]